MLCELATHPDGTRYCPHCGRPFQNLPPGARAFRRCGGRLPDQAVVAARIAANRQRIWSTVERLLAGPYYREHRPLAEMQAILARWEIRCCEPTEGELELYAQALLLPHLWRKEWGERPAIS
jgi:hypothetical protein